MNEDLSKLFEKFNINKDSISPEMIDSLMGMINNSNSTQDENTGSFDFETIMKMKSIMDKMNAKDNPRSKLLQSLKPYLKESRKEKLDQYIQLSKILEILPLIGGDKNVK